MKNSSELNEVLHRLEQLQKNVMEIKMAITGTSGTVSTSSVSKGTPTRMVGTEQIHRVSLEPLTEAQLAIFNEARSLGKEITAQDIQERLGYRSRATVSHNLNDLVRLGLLQKRRGKQAFYSVA